MERDRQLRREATWSLSHTSAQGITCAVCHDPHGSENSGSLRFPIDDPTLENNLCMKCHARRFEPDLTSNTSGPHAPAGPGAPGHGRLVSVGHGHHPAGHHPRRPRCQSAALRRLPREPVHGDRRLGQLPAAVGWAPVPPDPLRSTPVTGNPLSATTAALRRSHRKELDHLRGPRLPLQHRGRHCRLRRQPHHPGGLRRPDLGGRGCERPVESQGTRVCSPRSRPPSSAPRTTS